MKNITGLLLFKPERKNTFSSARLVLVGPRSTNDYTPQTLVTFEKNKSLYWNCILIKREINFSFSRRCTSISKHINRVSFLFETKLSTLYCALTYTILKISHLKKSTLSLCQLGDLRRCYLPCHISLKLEYSWTMS